MVLALLMSSLMVLGPFVILTNDIDPGAKALNIAIGEVWGYFAFVRPAFRSLRAWDASHPARSATSEASKG